MEDNDFYKVELAGIENGIKFRLEVSLIFPIYIPNICCNCGNIVTEKEKGGDVQIIRSKKLISHPHYSKSVDQKLKFPFCKECASEGNKLSNCVILHQDLVMYYASGIGPTTCDENLYFKNKDLAESFVIKNKLVPLKSMTFYGETPIIDRFPDPITWQKGEVIQKNILSNFLLCRKPQ
jgi:hypothetical protein